MATFNCTGLSCNSTLTSSETETTQISTTTVTISDLTDKNCTDIECSSTVTFPDASTERQTMTMIESSTATVLNCADLACNSSSTSPDIDIARRSLANDEKAVHYIPVMVYVALLMVVGVVGNSLVVYVYRRRFKKTSSNYFILTMATFDLVACLIGMPTEIYDLRYPYEFYSSPGCKILRFTETFTIYGSAVVLVEIAFDRYFKICRPLTEVSLIKIKLQCFLAVIIALALSAPTAVFFGITQNNIPGTNVIGYDCSIEDKYSKSTFQTVYYAILALIFVSTLLILTVLYMKIWLEIRHRKKMVIGDQITKPLDENKEKKEEEKKKVKVKYVPSTSDDDSCTNNNTQGYTSPKIQSVRSRFASLSSYASRIHVSRTTVILFTVTVAFVISYLPAIVIMIIRSVVKDIEETQTIQAEVASKLFSKFFLINNAINPIIYSFLNVNFRRQAKLAVKRVLCCCKSKRPFHQSRGSDRSTRSSKSSRSSKKTVDTVM